MQSDGLFSRRVAGVLPSVEELKTVMDGKRLRVYLGIDPTGGQLHIGHAIGIKKLMEFAEAGHESILLFGTGTVLVGDPSQRDTGRKTVTQDEIESNIATWKDQVAPIVDFSKITIKQNAEWITQLTLADIVNIASHISAVQLFKRESFTRRIERGDTVWYHETMYPLLQGYDSVVLDVDLEIGGTDQEFNMLIGRELQKKMNNREKFVLTTPMILGTDGQPMSKTSGNCVWLKDEPGEMFGKLMSIGDDQIIPYLDLCTDVAGDEISELSKQLTTGVNPRDIKLRMAEEICKIWHGPDLAAEVRAAWLAQFSDGALPADITEAAVALGERELDELLVEAGLVESKSAARRLFEQGAIRLNQDKVSASTVTVADGDVLQAGKRRFVRLRG